MRSFTQALFLLTLLCALMPAGSDLAQTPPPSPNQRTVDVTGHGDANAQPDTLAISFAVETQAPTAAECTRTHADKVIRIIDALKGKLGADTKIETTEYSLNPNISYVQVPAPTAGQPMKGLWDFKAELTASSDSIDIIGPLIDTAMAAGATDLQQSGVGMFPVEEEQSPYHFWGRKHRHEMKRMAYVIIVVEVQGTSATDASNKGGPRADKVQKALKDKLGDHGTVKLTQLNIAETGQNQGYRPPPQPTQQQVQNFAAHTTLIAESAKLDQLGPAVQAGLDSGATRLNQVQFTLHNDSDARKEAIEKASDEAKLKAEAVAKSMGVKLGKIIRITTTGIVRPQTIYGQTYQTAMATSAVAHQMQAAAVPVLPKEVGFSADVSVSYEIE